MATIRGWLGRFGKDQRGEVQVQYVVVAALIIVFCIWGIKNLGSAVNNQNNSTSNMLQNASTPSSS